LLCRFSQCIRMMKIQRIETNVLALQSEGLHGECFYYATLAALPANVTAQGEFELLGELGSAGAEARRTASHTAALRLQLLNYRYLAVRDSKAKTLGVAL
jgi:hypothetical protein